MKWLKSVLVTTVVVVFAFGSIHATNGKYAQYVPSGTSTVNVDFNRMCQGFAVFAYGADISVETYVGTTAQDSFVVEAGRSGFFYSPCDNVDIIRTTATAVLVNPTFNNTIIPNLGGTNSVDLLSPTPVTVSEHNIFTGLTMYSGTQGSATNLNMKAGGNAYRTFPVAGGVDVHGAKAMYLVLDYTNLEKGYFKLEHKFSASSTDTLFNYYNGDGWAFNDSVVVNDSTAVGALSGLPPDAAGTLVLRIPYESTIGAGYYFCKITAYDKVHTNWVTGLNATLVVVQ